MNHRLYASSKLLVVSPWWRSFWRWSPPDPEGVESQSPGQAQRRPGFNEVQTGRATPKG